MPLKQDTQQKESQWIIVTKNKKKHKGDVKGKTVLNKGNLHFFSHESKQQILEQFSKSSNCLKNKQLLRKVLSKFNEENQKLSGVNIVCLGLGNFLSSKKSFIQMIFFQEIVLNLMQRQSDGHQEINKTQANTINTYDPVFSQQEKAYIKTKIKSENIQHFQIHKSKLNIFYMPHCQRQLYERVLQKYKKQLESNAKINQKQPGQSGDSSTTHLIIIGNSILEYIQRCQLTKQQIPNVFKRFSMKEQKIFDYEEALNDTFVVYYD